MTTGKTIIKITNLKMPLDYAFTSIMKEVSKKFSIDVMKYVFKKYNFLDGRQEKGTIFIEVVKKSLDARKKDDLFYLLTVNVYIDTVMINQRLLNKMPKDMSIVAPTPIETHYFKKLDTRPVVVGFGPAGIFAALTLAKAGARPIVLERGSEVEKRTKEVNTFFNGGKLNTNSNVQFGEGGAGTFSDGKLTTGTKDVRIRNVLEEFVMASAPEEILYDAKPHMGTDCLTKVVKNLREKIIRLGGEIRFNAKVTDIKYKKNLVDNTNQITAVSVEQEKDGIVSTYDIETQNVILSIGHSARDSFEMLHQNGVRMEQKDFSVGVRIEHLQKKINKAMYGNFFEDKHLPPASYKQAVHLNNGRGVYTFCMCPGGVVVAASSEENTVVTNGMSYYARDKANANSAVLVGVSKNDFKSDDVLAGVQFQRKLEKKAFELGGSSYKAPAQRFGDFIKNIPTKHFGSVKPSYLPSVMPANLNELFDEDIARSLKLGISQMDNRLKGFGDFDSVLTGVESRSSSPVRILRDETLESLNFKGLYPCGEGAGYAGGIVSASVDGIKCAEAIVK